MSELRSDLEPLPPRIAKLPRHRGYPVPWFVEWVAKQDGELIPQPIGEGEPEFRIMSGERLAKAVNKSCCWVCGEKLGAYKAFTLGPMCAVNRTSSEPPSHRECAEWSARNCPFLSRPHMHRREAGLPDDVEASGGIMLKRNPGVALVWITRRYRPARDGRGGVVFRMGEPESVSWWAYGRPATRAEIEASIDTGVPALRELAEADGPAALTEFAVQLAQAKALLPAA